MLGLYRYFLAMTVASCHLWLQNGWWAAFYAVFCFYCISGYLMSLVLNQVYVQPGDNSRYIANRALRIYPPYLVVLGLTVIAVPIWPGALSENALLDVNLSHVLSVPEGAREWFTNLTFLYFGKREVLAVSQAWSLRVELFFYIAMIFLVRRALVVYAWFTLSLAYVVYMKISGTPFVDQYLTFAGSSVAFALGSAIYHVRQRFTLPRWHLALAAPLFLCHLVFADKIWNFGNPQGLSLILQHDSYGLYVNLLLGGYLLFALFSWPKSESSLVARIGKPLGDISYAIYLLHWLAGLVIVGAGISMSNKPVFIPVHFLVLTLASIALYRWVEKPVNLHFRDRIRERA